MLLFIICVAGFVVLDQVTKYLTVVNLKNDAAFPILKDIFELTYVENKGAAFGIFQEKRWFFILITIMVLVFILYYYFKLPRNRKYNPLKFSLILIVSGAIGNLIDRVRLGYVIDMLYFKLINFPVFNVADSYVVVGSILLMLLIMFKYKDHDFDFKKNEVHF